MLEDKKTPEPSDITSLESDVLLEYSSTLNRRAVVFSLLSEVVEKADSLLTNMERESIKISGGSYMTIFSEKQLSEYSGIRSEPGERWQVCGFSSQLISYLINSDEELQHLGVFAKSVQNQEFHKQLASSMGIDIDPKNSFRHGVTLVKIPTDKGDEHLVIDLSFTQFCSPTDNKIYEGNKTNNVNWEVNPVAQIFLKGTGILNLNDDAKNVFMYVCATSFKNNSDFYLKLRNIDNNKIAESFANTDAGCGVPDRVIEKFLQRLKI
jgi:hypothetical protein